MAGHGTLNNGIGRALPAPAFWRGKRVFMTGHTGFKGGWLAAWLHELGAVVAGYSLPPPTTPNIFNVGGIYQLLTNIEGDLRDFKNLCRFMTNFQPDVILHLAAQPLVRHSYEQPLETFSTNVMGTVNLLNAVNQLARATITLVITSDKVYAEMPGAERHSESDRLGGNDPYSASKACAELVCASYPMTSNHILATARSGNVIGGGDWAKDRLVADFMRAIISAETLVIRNGMAIRPWQHVLDPLCGYLVAVEYLWNNRPATVPAWNFGPDARSEVTVTEIATRLCRLWGNGASFKVEPATNAPRETPVLRLNSTKAQEELNWRPGWTLDQALSKTVDWFKEFLGGTDMSLIIKSQISSYGFA